MPMVHHICPTVVKRLHSLQFAGADAGEIMTDTAEGHLDEKSLISVGYDRASNQRREINGWAERPSPEAWYKDQGTKPAKSNSSSE
jgi:hypothetical protein